MPLRAGINPDNYHELFRVNFCANADEPASPLIFPHKHGCGSRPSPIHSLALTHFYSMLERSKSGCARPSRTANDGADVITIGQAFALRFKWEQQHNPSRCSHPTSEIEINNALTYLTGNIVCTICGTAVAPSRFVDLHRDMPSCPSTKSSASQ